MGIFKEFFLSLIHISGDTGFMLTCAALVFFMTPGLAFFYGGLVRRKNVVNTMMAIVMIMGLAVVMLSLIHIYGWAYHEIYQLV